MTTGKDVHSEVFAAFKALDDEMPRLLPLCTSEEEQKTLTSHRDDLEIAFINAKTAELKAFNQALQPQFDALKEINKTLKADLQEIKDIKAVLDLAAEVVRLATALAPLA